MEKRQSPNLIAQLKEAEDQNRPNQKAKSNSSGKRRRCQLHMSGIVDMDIHKRADLLGHQVVRELWLAETRELSSSIESVNTTVQSAVKGFETVERQIQTRFDVVNSKGLRSGG
jgi:hypothetical protein